MLFTAQPLPRNTTSSRLFTEFGASGLAPCPVSDARVSGTPHTPQQADSSLLLKNLLAPFIECYNKGKSVRGLLSGYYNSFNKAHVGSEILVPIPPTITTFTPAPAESLKVRIEGKGFVESSTGKYHYYQSQGSMEF